MSTERVRYGVWAVSACARYYYKALELNTVPRGKPAFWADPFCTVDAGPALLGVLEGGGLSHCWASRTHQDGQRMLRPSCDFNPALRHLGHTPGLRPGVLVGVLSADTTHGRAASGLGAPPGRAGPPAVAVSAVWGLHSRVTTRSQAGPAVRARRERGNILKWQFS